MKKVTEVDGRRRESNREVAQTVELRGNTYLLSWHNTYSRK